MTVRVALALSLAAVCLGSPAQQAPSLDGKWTGTMPNRSGNEMAVEVSITDNQGTFRYLVSGKSSRNSCVGPQFPITVTSKPDGSAVWDIKGSALVSGCIDATVMVQATSPTTVDGVFKDGRVLKLSRQ
jgi:hypothetical protein